MKHIIEAATQRLKVTAAPFKSRRPRALSPEDQGRNYEPEADPAVDKMVTFLKVIGLAPPLIDVLANELVAEGIASLESKDVRATIKAITRRLGDPAIVESRSGVSRFYVWKVKGKGAVSIERFKGRNHYLSLSNS